MRHAIIININRARCRWKCVRVSRVGNTRARRRRYARVFMVALIGGDRSDTEIN